MKGSAILFIVLICSVIAPSYAKATKKHPILQRRSLISLKDDFITPINANANSTIVKRDDNKNSNETAQKKEEILTTLQGAYSENEWNMERLEAIAASGGEAGAIAQSILAKKAENAENVKGVASNKALTASAIDVAVE